MVSPRPNPAAHESSLKRAMYYIIVSRSWDFIDKLSHFLYFLSTADTAELSDLSRILKYLHRVFWLFMISAMVDSFLLW